MNNNRSARRLKKRYRAEKRFRLYGLCAVLLALFFLASLFISIGSVGWTAISQTKIRLDLNLSLSSSSSDQHATDYTRSVKAALHSLFPEAQTRAEKKMLYALLSPHAGYEVSELVDSAAALKTTTISLWLSADDKVDQLIKGKTTAASMAKQQIVWINALQQQGRIEKKFNRVFFSGGDSRNPERAGILGALIGSFLTLTITFLIAFPLGTATAIYLEEFAPKNRITDLIEVNINNLAAVPSIIFGLLGLAMFINFFGIPRSTPLVGGMVLGLMTLPTIIIASRAAIKSIPQSIREAALGVGASHIQSVFHFVVPLALPGMLTGSIIGMAQALGETAPLLLVGMLAFLVEIPDSFLASATALPAQIYLWSKLPETAFVEKTAAAIIVLVAMLVVINISAIIARKKFEHKW